MGTIFEILGCLCVVILCGIKPLTSASCPQTSHHCFPIRGPEQDNICVYFSNATDVTWFRAKSECEADGGRLAHIGNYSTEHALTTAAKSETGSKHSIDVRVGVLLSIRGDDMTFTRNTSDLQCSDKMTRECSSTKSQIECVALGCCFQAGICQYPENQFVAKIELSSTQLHSTLGTDRSCIQLNSNNTWSPFNCSEPGDANTVYACERKCSANWPVEFYEQITWTEHANTSSVIPEYTTKVSALHSASVFTPMMSGGSATGLASPASIRPLVSSVGASGSGAITTTIPPPDHFSVTTWLASHSQSLVQHKTTATVKETSSEGNQNVACQFNVQVILLMILTTMPTVCL